MKYILGESNIIKTLRVINEINLGGMNKINTLRVNLCPLRNWNFVSFLDDFNISYAVYKWQNNNVMQSKTRSNVIHSFGQKYREITRYLLLL